MPSTPFATGHCLCGAVSFTINAAPIGTGQCHCKDCQRASGTGHMSLARFNRNDVELKGETTSFASTAERGTFSSASPGLHATTSSSPGASRSSASLVRTQVSGQVTSVTSSACAATGSP